MLRALARSAIVRDLAEVFVFALVGAAAEKLVDLAGDAIAKRLDRERPPAPPRTAPEPEG